VFRYYVVRREPRRGCSQLFETELGETGKCVSVTFAPIFCTEMTTLRKLLPLILHPKKERKKKTETGRKRGA
jgi:hypothetical protein